jgi:hypothetical protein
VLTPESFCQIALCHTSGIPQRTDMLAEKLGEFAVQGFSHAGILPAKALASKMRAVSISLNQFNPHAHELLAQNRP